MYTFYKVQGGAKKEMKLKIEIRSMSHQLTKPFHLLQYLMTIEDELA